MRRAALLSILTLAACAPTEVRLAREAASADGGVCEAVASHCDALPALPFAPVIDGALEDCGLALETIPRENWLDGDALPPEHEVRFAAAWRPDGLYFFVQVRDATLSPSMVPDQAWCGDAVHLFADADGTYASPGAYDDPGTMQLIARAPLDATARREGDRYDPSVRRGTWDPSSFVAVTTADGYAVEAFVRAPELELASWSLARGQRVGMDLAVGVSGVSVVGSDAPPCAAGRLGDYAYRDVFEGGERRTPHTTSAAFCNPELR